MIMRDILSEQETPSLNIGPGMAILEKMLPTSHLKVTLDLKTKYLTRLKGIPNIHLINATAEFLPFRDSSIPTITTQSTFQIIHDQKGFLKELSRTLSSNGFFIITIEHKARTYPNADFKICDTDNELDNLLVYICSLKLKIFAVKSLNYKGEWVNSKEEGFSIWIFGGK